MMTLLRFALLFLALLGLSSEAQAACPVFDPLFDFGKVGKIGPPWREKTEPPNDAAKASEKAVLDAEKAINSAGYDQSLTSALRCSMSGRVC